MSIQSVNSQNNPALASINPTSYTYPTGGAAPMVATSGGTANAVNCNLFNPALGMGGKNFNPQQLLVGLIQLVVSLINQLAGFFGGGQNQPGINDGKMHPLLTPQLASSDNVGTEATSASAGTASSGEKKSTWSKVIEAGVDIASSYFGSNSSSAAAGSSKSGFDWGSAFKTVAGWFGY